MSIGKEWKKRRADLHASKRNAAKVQEESVFRGEAESAITQIPHSIERSIENDKDSIDVLHRSMREATEVACGDASKLLVDLRKKKRPLKAADLAGAARLVFEWCVKNDLACFIQLGPPNYFNQVLYELRARPV